MLSQQALRLGPNTSTSVLGREQDADDPDAVTPAAAVAALVHHPAEGGVVDTGDNEVVRVLVEEPVVLPAGPEPLG